MYNQFINNHDLLILKEYVFDIHHFLLFATKRCLKLTFRQHIQWIFLLEKHANICRHRSYLVRFQSNIWDTVSCMCMVLWQYVLPVCQNFNFIELILNHTHKLHKTLWSHDENIYLICDSRLLNFFPFIILTTRIITLVRWYFFFIF